jgi:Flp pilus assembly protein TadG
MSRSPCKHALRASRRGAAAVEFALTASVLFLLAFAAIELSRFNQMRHTADNAVYEGARRGIVPGASADDVVAAAQSIINTASVRNAEIVVEPSVIDGDTEEVTVSVTISVSDNSWAPPVFFANRSVSSSLTLQREKYDYATVP